MSIRTTLLAAALLVPALAAAPALAGDHPSGGEHPAAAAEHPQAAGENPKAGKDLAAVVSATGELKTLARAIEAAGLVETLRGKGPFTIFAPTNEAFRRLPKGALESLLKPENKAELAAIVTNHVLPGKLLAADLKTGKTATVAGPELAIQVGKDGVKVGQGTVVATDLVADNGVIHFVDTVLMPAAPPKEAAGKAKPKDHPGH